MENKKKKVVFPPDVLIPWDQSWGQMFSVDHWGRSVSLENCEEDTIKT